MKQLNIVTCGNCGQCLVHKIGVEFIICSKCGLHDELSSFPDAYIHKSQIDSAEITDEVNVNTALGEIISAEYNRSDETPKLFYVVDPQEKNREIFETLEEAEEFAKSIKEPFKISIADVRNYYLENNGKWNYEDKIDTFKIRSTIIHHN